MNRIARLMATNALQGWPRKKKRGQRGRPGFLPPAVKNMLERGFNAMGPERKWVTDVTEIKPMKASKYFLAFNALR